MDKIWFETHNGKLEIDISGRFQMTKGSEYVSLKLKPDQIDKIVKFLLNIRQDGNKND